MVEITKPGQELGLLVWAVKFDSGSVEVIPRGALGSSTSGIAISDIVTTYGEI